MRTRRFGWQMRSTAVGTSVVMLVTMLAQTGAFAKPQPKPTQREPEMRPGQTQRLTPEQLKAIDAAREKAEQARRSQARPLLKQEMAALMGRGSLRNKYFTTFPWHRSLRDANLCNGNLFKSFTDIQVAPARGAGLVLQRTYNSNDDQIGPFGIGWEHAYDIHMQEEANAYTSGQDDAQNNMVGRKDFFGATHKYHRDADGLYSPPPYMFDETSSEYDTFLVNGPTKSLADTDRSMDGTVKHFILLPDSGSTRYCDSITDRHGNVTTLAYTAVTSNGATKNLLTTVTDPSNRQLSFTWTNLGTSGSPAWRITLVQGPQDVVSYAYNVDFNLQSVTLDPGDPASHLNRTTSFAYSSVSDGQGNTASGLLASITDPLGHVLSYGYQLNTITNTVWVSSITEPAGITTGGATRTQTWTLSTSIGTYLYTQFTNGQGLVFKLWTDTTTLRKFGYAYGTGGTFFTYYDTANNVTKQATPMASVDGQSYVTLARWDDFTYGPHGNMLTHTIEGFSGTETTTYYNASQYFMKASVTDMNGHHVDYTVGTNTDANLGNRGSVLTVTDPRSGAFAYTYNSYGQKISETNPNNVVSNYTYADQWGNLTQVVQDPNPQGQSGHLARTTSINYDVAGHVLSRTDPVGRTVNFNYNVAGQPLTASFPATLNGQGQIITPAENYSYTYGANGRTGSVTDNRGTTSLTYENGCDRVSSITDPITGAVSYTYALNGERLSMSLPGGGTWNYTYSGTVLPKDDPNRLSQRLTRLTDDQGRIVDYGLDQFGPLKWVQFNQTFNGSSLTQYCRTDYTYDVDSQGIKTHGWLKQIKNSWNWKTSPYPPPNGTFSQQTLVQNAYTFDNTGQRLTNAISDSTGLVRTESYGYDAANELTSVNYGDGQTQSYSFDAMGNRSSKTDVGGGINGTENYTYNAANMLLTRGANTYTNDLAGNTLTGGGRTNTWDSQNRLVQCVSGGNTSVFTYGIDGQRHRSVVNGTTTDFVLDNSMFVRERRNGNNVATYFFGARGPEYRRDDSTNMVRWYLYDGLGSVVGEVDPNGTITSSRKYDVYGSVRGGNNPGGTSKHKFVGQLGHPSEDETGLIYMQARYVDPQIGRFVSEDPSQNGANWFAYCSGDPVNVSDANGCKGKRPDATDMTWWIIGIFSAVGALSAVTLAWLTTGLMRECFTMAAVALAGFAVIGFAYSVAGLTDREMSYVITTADFAEWAVDLVVAAATMKKLDWALPGATVAVTLMFVDLCVVTACLLAINADP